jgi:hypothetical protein
MLQAFDFYVKPIWLEVLCGLRLTLSGRRHNFLMLMGGLLHFATYGLALNWPFCTHQLAVRGVSQRKHREGRLQRVERGIGGRRMRWLWQSGARAAPLLSAFSVQRSAFSVQQSA